MSTDITDRLASEDSGLAKTPKTPQLVIRPPKTDWERIRALLGAVQEQQNARRDPGSPEWTQNAVLVRALYLGLEQLKKEKR